MTRFVEITKACGPAAAIVHSLLRLGEGHAISIDTIVVSTGVKRLTVIRAITYLEVCGFIKIERRQSKASVYRCVAGAPKPITKPKKKAVKSRKATEKKTRRKPSLPRKPDVIFDYVCDRWFEGAVINSNRKLIAKLAHGFKGYGATVAEIAAREERYRSGTDWDFTPAALLKHWSRFKDDSEAPTEMFPDDANLQPIPDDYEAEKPWERARRLKQEAGGSSE